MKIIEFSVDAKDTLRQHACFISQGICEIIQIPKDVKRNDQVKLFQYITNPLQIFIQGGIIEMISLI